MTEKGNKITQLIMKHQNGEIPSLFICECGEKFEDTPDPCKELCESCYADEINGLLYGFDEEE